MLLLLATYNLFSVKVPSYFPLRDCASAVPSIFSSIFILCTPSYSNPYLEKIDKSDKPIAKLIMTRRKRTQIIRSKRGDISTDSPGFKSIRKYHEKIYANKLDNLE